jgi:hypothetical protein
VGPHHGCGLWSEIRVGCWLSCWLNSNYYGTINGIKTTLVGGISVDSFMVQEWHYFSSGMDAYYNECVRFEFNKERSLSCSFDLDGNILVYTNRFDFDKLNEDEFKSKEDVLEESILKLKETIGSPTEMLFHGNKWYTDKYMFMLYENPDYHRVIVTAVPHKLTLSSGVVTYKGSSGPTHSRPKNVVSVDVQTLYDAYKLKVEELWKQE